jgi:Glycosyl transferase family 2
VLGRLRRAVDWRLAALTGRLDELSARVDLIRDDAARTRALLEDELAPVVRAIADEDAANRRRLHALRAHAEYLRPFTEPDPLVSVTIATRDRPELLVRRALASLLVQTHERLEVLVVGDAAGPEVAAAIAAIGDPRVRYANLTQRLTAHEDPRRHWLVGSTMARNEAARRAGGLWLLHFDDDDELRPDAIEALLAHARETRAEVAYGGWEEHLPGGERETRLGFPPVPETFGWQGALHHAGLAFFERELHAAHYALSGDAYLLRRMLRAGVRFSMLERVVWDYHPSTAWERT